MPRPTLTEAQLATRTTSRCIGCGLDKPLGDFARDRSRRPLLVSSRCKPCASVYQAEWRRANAERKRANDAAYYEKNRERIAVQSRDYRERNREARSAYSSRWARENPDKHAEQRRIRRARLAGVQHVPYTPEQFQARMSLWGGLCWICRLVPWEVGDHVKPLAAGGPDMLSNLRPACNPCNSKKRHTWPFTAPKGG